MKGSDMNETVFRIIAGVVLFAGIGISIYFRSKADRLTGEKVSRRSDGTAMMNVIRFAGLFLWLSPVAYIVNPAWMEWSKIGLPEPVRWIGGGVGVACVPAIYWLFSSIGTGITPTSATRKDHVLVTSGPYKWVRHPLYTIGTALFAGIGTIADNWFIIALGLCAFVVMAVRTPKEEANLIEKFGDEYRTYMKNTGRFLPRIFRR